MLDASVLQAVLQVNKKFLKHNKVCYMKWH